MTETPERPPETEQRKVSRIYAAMTAATVFYCVPLAAMQAVALLLTAYVMVSAYILRSRFPEQSLTHDHMAYLIRTFWVSSILFAAGFAAAGIILARTLDIESINALSATLMSGRFVVTDEVRTLALVSLATMGPSAVYFIYRIAKGLSRALRGHRMGNDGKWL